MPTWPPSAAVAPPAQPAPTWPGAASVPGVTPLSSAPAAPSWATAAAQSDPGPAGGFGTPGPPAGGFGNYGPAPAGPTAAGGGQSSRKMPTSRTLVLIALVIVLILGAVVASSHKKSSKSSTSATPAAWAATYCKTFSTSDLAEIKILSSGNPFNFGATPTAGEVVKIRAGIHAAVALNTTIGRAYQTAGVPAIAGGAEAASDLKFTAAQTQTQFEQLAAAADHINTSSATTILSGLDAFGKLTNKLGTTSGPKVSTAASAAASQLDDAVTSSASCTAYAKADGTDTHISSNLSNSNNG